MAAGALLEPIVRLRLAILGARDPALRAELRAIEVALRNQIGPAVPKRAAARLLGVSVTALDRWIDRGFLPVVSSSRAAGRQAVEIAPLLELATAVRDLRRAGRTRAVLSEAFRRLGWAERGHRVVYGLDVARLPRPNVSVDELQRHYRETVPQERVLQLAALNRSLDALAAGAWR
jgi:hypothetical protein